jgi:Transposase DDE domain
MLREVRYRTDPPGFRTREITLITTLLDAEVYRVSDLAELYRQRWQVETALAQLKTSMQMDVLHGQTVAGTLKELTVFAIVDNLVRMVMWPSAARQQTAAERISFLDALRWLSTPGTGMPLEALIIIPVCPNRVEPRVKKRRPKSFPLMITPRPELRQRLVPQELRG